MEGGSVYMNYIINPFLMWGSYIGGLMGFYVGLLLWANSGFLSYWITTPIVGFLFGWILFGWILFGWKFIVW